MSELDVVEAFRKSADRFRRQVSINRDGEDFVVTFLPQNIDAARHSEAAELRKMCHFLRWEIVSDASAVPELNTVPELDKVPELDTVPDLDDIRTW
jgi:hypothetical protein